MIVVHGVAEFPELFLLSPGQTTFGKRPANQLRLSDPTVSGHHGTFLLEHGALSVTDMGAVHGIKIVGGPTLRPGDPVHRLLPGDRLEVGRFVLQVDLPPGELTLRAARRQLQHAGLAMPPVPPELASRVVQHGRWIYGTTPAKEIYGAQVWLLEQLGAGVVEDYVLLYLALASMVSQLQSAAALGPDGDRPAPVVPESEPASCQSSLIPLMQRAAELLAAAAPAVIQVELEQTQPGLFVGQLEGLELDPELIDPPPCLPVHAGRSCLRINTDGRRWQRVVEQRTIAIYQPISPDRVKLELYLCPPLARDQPPEELELEQTQPGLFVGRIDDPALLQGRELTLVAGGDAPDSTFTHDLPRYIKVGTLDSIAQIVQVTLDGVPVKVVKPPPDLLSGSADIGICLRLQQVGQHWDELARAETIAIYQPISPDRIWLKLLLGKEQRSPEAPSPAVAMAIPLEQTAPGAYRGTLSETQLQHDAGLYLVARGAAPDSKEGLCLLQYLKIGALDELGPIVSDELPGVETSQVEDPPEALDCGEETICLQLIQHGEQWQRVQQQGTVGIYQAVSPDNISLELLLLR